MVAQLPRLAGVVEDGVHADEDTQIPQDGGTAVFNDPDRGLGLAVVHDLVQIGGTRL